MSMKLNRYEEMNWLKTLSEGEFLNTFSKLMVLKIYASMVTYLKKRTGFGYINPLCLPSVS